MIEERAEVVVVGAGIAGFAAAVAARESGRDVLLLEKGPAPGGSAAMSGGTIWTGTDYDEVRRIMPEGDPELLRILIAELPVAVEWLAGHGVPVEENVPATYRFARRVWAMLPDAAGGMASFARRFAALGGRLMTDTAAIEILQDDAGRVEGVRARTTGDGLVARARGVVLASGGFQGNTELLTRYMGRWADRMHLRGNPYSTGDGLLMGSAAGAATSRGMHAFYGHLLPAPPARLDPPAYTRVTPYFSEHAVIVNLDGRRFVDESLGDEVSAQETARQREARSIVIFDAVVHRDYAITPRTNSDAIDKVAAVREIGGPVVEAGSLAKLVEAAASWGVHAASLERTLAEYDAAAAAGRADRLEVPRRAQAHRLRQPPFYALLMRPGITFTNGGLKIDTSTRVLDRSGRPIPGLFAAGADGGGVFYESYAGGLALGLVFGRIAGRAAAST